MSLPSLSAMAVKPLTTPIADAAPGTFALLSSIAWVSSGVLLIVLPLSSWDLACTATSTWPKPLAELFWYASEMVLVKTSVPETNATPSITASTVIRSRALCASTLRRAVRNISWYGPSCRTRRSGAARRSHRCDRPKGTAA